MMSTGIRILKIASGSVVICMLMLVSYPFNPYYERLSTGTYMFVEARSVSRLSREYLSQPFVFIELYFGFVAAFAALAVGKALRLDSISTIVTAVLAKSLLDLVARSDTKEELTAFFTDLPLYLASWQHTLYPFLMPILFYFIVQYAYVLATRRI